MSLRQVGVEGLHNDRANREGEMPMVISALYLIMGLG